MSKIYKARVPTNIAFLKYWGKEDESQQWPCNDSLSMSLDLYTETFASLIPFGEKDPAYIYFNSDEEVASASKFLKKSLKQLHFLKKERGAEICPTLYIKTRNEFPSACGIASSASGLASLTLACLAAWTDSSSFQDLKKNGFSKERLAYLARLGSGSACRSLWGGFVHWKKNLSPQDQETTQLHEHSHWNLRDCIVIISDKEKGLSSTEGHRLAKTSPLFKERLERLPHRLENFRKALVEKNIFQLGSLLEEEAMEMHAVMETSQPPCPYMSEETRAFLKELKKKRERTQIPIFYTMDAGPNVHLIYEETNKEAVLSLFEGYRVIDVSISEGPSIERFHV